MAGVPVHCKGAGCKMIGIMTIQTASITILKLALVGVLVATLAYIRCIGKTLRAGLRIHKVTLGAGQVGVRLGQGKPFGVPGSIYGAGLKMSLGMTIPTTGIAFPELIPMGILVTTLTMTRLPQIAGAARIGIAFGIRAIRWMARFTRQTGVSAFQCKSKLAVDLEINAPLTL
jgi:hypothetical protein